jgi:uncharacterized membrane protein
VDLLWLAWWWLLWLALALLYQPLATRLLGSLVDGGWAFARVLGLGVSSYLCWLAASLEWLPFSRASVLAAAALPGLALHLEAGGIPALRRFLRRRRPALLAIEGLFGAVLLLWTLGRALWPDIAGLEKFMDYGFAAAAVRSRFMPPPDMWFAGETINYYYYGHYLLAFLAKGSGVPLPIAYNLMIATLPALCATLGFTLTAQLTRALGGLGRRRRLAGGLLGAGLLVFGGNLHGCVYGVALPAAEAAGLREAEFRSPMQVRAGQYWFPDATRFVGHNPPTDDKLIHEFPFYSFLVADLHAHVSGLPFVLTILALLLAHALPPARPGTGALGERLGLGAPLGFLLGLIRMTNTWDLPIYGAVSAAVLGAAALRAPGGLARAVAGAALTLGIAAGVAFLVSLPFALHFEQHYGVVQWARAHTPPSQLAVLWGAPVIVAGVFALRLLGGALRSRSLARAEAVWLALAACALGLLVVPELVVLRDIYPVPYERGNTYFKLSYQAFVLFCLLLPAALLAPGGRGWRRALGVALVAPLFCYAPLAIRGHFGPPSGWRVRGLDGLLFLEERRPGEGRAVAWLRANAPPGAALLEADGDSYTDAGRFSMATGIPTLLGWYVHEWLWRGAREPANERKARVRVVYEWPRLSVVKELLGGFGVRYIVVGKLERERFRSLDLAGLEALGRVAFSAGEVEIIEVAPPGPRASPASAP